jgi:predicted AAA+ superfamily ATPase
MATMIERIQKQAFSDRLETASMILLKGPKGVGKQTFLKNIFDENKFTDHVVDCDNKKVRKEIQSIEDIASMNSDVIVLREAQFLPNLQSIMEGVLMGKLNSKLIVSCSYKPMIDPELIEAMDAEGLVFHFFAPSFSESAKHFGLTKEEELLEERLIYGNTPGVLNDIEHAELTLREMIQEVIDTQFGAVDRINKKDKMMRMLQLLAFNIGAPISYNDLGERCGLDNETVERYIQLFEDAHVLIKLPSYSNGHRYELKKTHCVYFQDNGIRNVLISNFNPTFLRNDMDQLWRNYLVSERVKWIRMNNMDKKMYFWRTHTRQQMDFVEVGESTIMAYKTDFEKRKKVKIPLSFTTYYPEAKSSVLNKSTYWNFLTRKA